jgi:hypothetical protein
MNARDMLTAKKMGMGNVVVQLRMENIHVHLAATFSMTQLLIVANNVTVSKTKIV